jgi:hypothetical protein
MQASKSGINEWGVSNDQSDVQQETIHNRSTPIGLSTFHGKIPQGMVVNHKDGNKKNNLLSNLEIATPQQNSIHSIHVLKHGNVLNQWGENNPSAKLTNKQVLEIIDRRKQGETLKTIAQDYNVTIQTISKIVLGQRRQKNR